MVVFHKWNLSLLIQRGFYFLFLVSSLAKAQHKTIVKAGLNPNGFHTGIGFNEKLGERVSGSFEVYYNALQNKEFDIQTNYSSLEVPVTIKAHHKAVSLGAGMQIGVPLKLDNAHISATTELGYDIKRYGLSIRYNYVLINQRFNNDQWLMASVSYLLYKDG